LLLDEPTVGVDPQSRERIYEMLGSLREAGMSIVLTTHHLEEAQERCQRVLIIDHGKIVAAGTVRDLVRQHLGGARTVRVLLSGALPPAAVLPDGVSTSVDRQALQCAVGESHVDADIASLARVAAAAGLSVRDVTVSGVSLQDVFIALTGRELRE
jgi:ABC-2 type transport system ATP-binding protein